MDNKKLEKLVQKFNDGFSTVNEINYSFAEMFNKLLELKEISKDEFMQEVGLSDRTFQRYSKGIGDPSLKSLVTFCMAFEIDNNSFLTLLRAGGYSINFTNRTHCAYAFLLTDCMGMTISECNEVLQALGVQQRDLLTDTWA